MVKIILTMRDQRLIFLSYLVSTVLVLNGHPILSFARASKRSLSVEPVATCPAQCPKDSIVDAKIINHLIRIDRVRKDQACGGEKEQEVLSHLGRNLTRELDRVLKDFRALVEKKLTVMEPRFLLGAAFPEFLAKNRSDVQANQKYSQYLNQMMNTGRDYARSRNAEECSGFLVSKMINSYDDVVKYAECFKDRSDKEFLFSAYDVDASTGSVNRGMFNSYVDIISEQVKLRGDDLGKVVSGSPQLVDGVLNDLSKKTGRNIGFLRYLMLDPRTRGKTQFVLMTMNVSSLISMVSGSNSVLKGKLNQSRLSGLHFRPLYEGVRGALGVGEGKFGGLGEYFSLIEMHEKMRFKEMAKKQLSADEERAWEGEIRETAKLKRGILSIINRLKKIQIRIEENPCINGDDIEYVR